MNILLAVVGKAFDGVYDNNVSYYYQQIAKQICMLQRIFFLLKHSQEQGLQLITRVRKDIIWKTYDELD